MAPWNYACTTRAHAEAVAIVELCFCLVEKFAEAQEAHEEAPLIHHRNCAYAWLRLPCSGGTRRSRRPLNLDHAELPEQTCLDPGLRSRWPLRRNVQEVRLGCARLGPDGRQGSKGGPLKKSFCSNASHRQPQQFRQEKQPGEAIGQRSFDERSELGAR